MRRWIVHTWFCVALFCDVVQWRGAVQAADQFPWDAETFSSSPEATLRAAKELPPPEKASVDVLLDEMKFEFDEARRVRKTHRRVYRLLTKDALEEWSVVTAAWSPWHEERPVIQVRVVSTDGQAHMLDAGAISESPMHQSGHVFVDRRRLVAPLPAVEVGAVVESQVVTAEHRSFCDKGVFEEHFFYASEPVRSMRLIVEAPDQGPPLIHRVRGVELPPKRTVENGRLRLEFGPIASLPPEKIEGSLPSELPLLPHAVIGNGSGWADVAKYYAELVDQQIGDASYAETAHNMVGDEKSRLPMIQKLLDGVQKRVRYVGIEFGEASIVPDTPAETLKLRYGDCKDQSTLLVALLRSLGHPAHVALLRAGRREDLLPDVPALNAFDHAIVYVPGEPALWIDPTVSLLRVGELPAADKGRLALIASPTTTELVRTPEARAVDNRVIRTRELVVVSGDDGLLRESIEFHGSYENQVRSYYAETKVEDLRQRLEQLLEEDYEPDSVTKFEFGDPHDLAAAFRLTYEADGINHGVSVPSCTVWLRPDLLLDDIPWTLRQSDEQPKSKTKAGDSKKEAWTRSSPLQFPTPFVKELRYRVILPAGFHAQKLPDAISKRFGPVSISAEFTKESDNLVLANFLIDTGDGRLTPDKAAALRKYVGELHSEHEGTWYVKLELEHTALQHIAEGRISEGLAEFQRVLTQHPHDFRLRTLYIENLVTVGIGAEAHAEGRRAVEIDVTSSLAWQALGYALMHDEFGRFMGPGINPQDSEAAFRKALEIDPDFHLARRNLAMTLEYGEGPRRYGNRERLKEAAEHYRKLREEEYDDEDFSAKELWTLAHLDNWQEVIELAKELEPSVARNGMWVAALAVTVNTKTAKAKAFELAATDDARRELLLIVSDILNFGRQYRLSAELVEHALMLIADPAQKKRVQDFAAAVKKMKQVEEVLFPAGDPRRLVQDLHVAVYSGGSVKSAMPLFADDVREEDALNAMESIRERSAETLRTMLMAERRVDRIADMASLLEFKSEGDADMGFRVVSGIDRWYIVKRNTKLGLLPQGFECSELGREALRRLETGDNDGAQRWLEWAAAELPAPKGLFADPFSVSPFGFLWHGLKRDQLKIAAALLASPGGHSDDGLQILTEYRASATPKVRLLQVERALAASFEARSDWERLLETVERIQATQKKAPEPQRMKLVALKGLDRVDEFWKADELRSAGFNGWKKAWSEAFTASKRGDFELSEKLLRPIADDPTNKVEPYVFNQLAWNALFLDPMPTETALEDAIKANQSSNYRTPQSLHTLATIHAELKQPAEAIRYLIQSIDARDGKPENQDYYVLGRIEECYGLNDIAARHYEQIKPNEFANSTYRLAQRGLKRLGR